MTIHIGAEENQAEWIRGGGPDGGGDGGGGDGDGDGADGASDRVWVSSRHDAPSGAVVRYDADAEALYYDPETADGGRPPQASKSWAPYEGPQGGSGWRNTETGRVVYQDEPPGERLTADDVSDSLLEEAGVGEDDAFVDISGSVRLDDEAKERLRGAFDSAFGDEAEDVYRQASMWKHSSYQDAAQTRERAMMEAFGVGGEPRNGDLDGDEPSDGLVAATGVLGRVSREVLRGSEADNGDGTVTVHRGLGDTAGRDLDTQFLEALAGGDDTFVFEENPAANYSQSADVASRWGSDTATITETVPIDDVLVATDAVLKYGGDPTGEGEVTIEGNRREVGAGGVRFRSDDGPSNVLEGSGDYDDLSVAYQLTTDVIVNDTPLTPESVDGALELAERLHGVEDEPIEGMSDELAGDIETHVQAAREYEPGSDTIGALEEALADHDGNVNLPSAMLDADPDLGNDLNGVAFEAAKDVEDEEDRDAAATAAVLDEVRDRAGATAEDGRVAQFVRDLNQRYGLGVPAPLPGRPAADEKAEGPIDLTADPDSVDWVARSRDDADGGGGDGRPPQAQKEWVPYDGPRGGSGWRSTVTQGIRYTDEKPDETEDVDIDSITAEDVADVRISQIPVWEQMEPHEADEGRPVEVETDRFGTLRGEVTGAGGDAVEVVDETGRERSFGIVDGEIDGDVSMRKEVTYASGVAAAEEPLVPDEGEPTEPQVAAEALRRAASIDSFYETGPMRDFVADMRGRGVDEPFLESVVEAAVGENPALQDHEFDEIMEGPVDAKSWVPYAGPQGGEGWREVDSGRVVYGEEPPGGVVDPSDLSDEGVRRIADEAGVEPEDVRETLERLSGGDGGVSRDSKEAFERFAEDWFPPGELPPYEDFEVQYGWMSDVDGANIPDEAPGKDDLREYTSEALAEWLVDQDATAPPKYADEGPFSGFDGSDRVPETLDPRNAEETTGLSDTVPEDETGRSVDSMYVAEGVPDGDGGERRLFITNTNPDRGEAQDDREGQNAVAGSAGFNASPLIDAPAYAHEPGEFWVAEEADGEPASRKDWTSLGDTPEDAKWEVVELSASAMVLGAWDMHADNVFVTPDGELSPVDLDLAGADLANGWYSNYDNPMSGGQQNAWERFRGLWESLGMDETDQEWDDAVETIADRVRQLVDDGDAAEMMSAAQGATDDPELSMSMDENKFAMNRGEYITDEDTDAAKEVSPW